jgi:hypothetical protein
MLVLLFLSLSPFQTREARQFPAIPYRPFPLDFFDSLGRMDRRLLRSTYAYISQKSRKIVIIQPLRHQGTNSNCKFSIVNFQLFVPWWLPEQSRKIL